MDNDELAERIEVLKNHLLLLDARIGRLEGQALGHRDSVAELRSHVTALRPARDPS